jgi:hypothetical protein
VVLGVNMSQQYQNMWERDHRLLFEAYVWFYVFCVLFPAHRLTIKLYFRWKRRMLRFEAQWGRPWDFRSAHAHAHELISDVTI